MFRLGQNHKTFWDTQIIKENKIKTQVFVKSPYIQSIDRQKCHLNIRMQLMMIASNFLWEIDRIKAKSLKVGFSRNLIENINNFNNVEEETITPASFFDEWKIAAIILPFSECYTNGKVKFNIIWATMKTKPLLKIIKVKHLKCITYQEICSFGNHCIGDTMRNTTARYNEHKQPNGKFEPSKQLESNPWHNCDGMIL